MWGRIDDGYWDHDKTTALIELGSIGREAIGAFWVIDSYCHKVRRPTVTIWEIAMLLRVSHDEAERIIAPLLVAPEGYENGFLLRSRPEKSASSASKQTENCAKNGQLLLQSKTEAYEVNSFAEYLGKNEAKVIAGSKGGKKSGESRRKKSKQNRSKIEAPPKNTRSKTQAPGPDPGPDPIPVPDPGPDTRRASRESSSWAPGDLISTTADLEEALSAWSLQAGNLTSATRKLCHQLTSADPIQPHEYQFALEETRRREPKRPVQYLLGVIVGQRRDASEVDATGLRATKPTGPPSLPQWALDEADRIAEEAEDARTGEG